MKRFFILLIVSLSLFSVSSYAGTFSDVSENHWAYDVISQMAREQILSGYPDGTFLPNKSISRAEFAKILVLSLNMNQEQGYKFSDVSEEHWAKGYIDTISNYLDAYIEGENRFFRPDKEVVREEVVRAMVLALGIDTSESEPAILNRFKDKDAISENMKEYIATAVEMGIVRGNADGTFNPKGKLTRAEVCQLMYNAKDVMEYLSTHNTNQQIPYVSGDATFHFELVSGDAIFELNDEGILYGDMNGNGTLFEEEGFYILMYEIELATHGEVVEGLNYDNADMNEDGYIDLFDASLLVAYRNSVIVDENPLTVPMLGQNVLWGDFNFDGVVNDEDHAIMTQYLEKVENEDILKIINPTETTKKFRNLYDVNQDGVINSKDLYFWEELL